MRVAALSLLALLAMPAAASRGGATFDLTITGVPIGWVALDARAAGGRYRLEGSGDVGFLFWGGVGSARTEGAAGAELSPDAYRLAWEGATQPGRIEIDFDDAIPVRWLREPPPRPEWTEGRIEIEPAHLPGALDPLTALVIPAPLDAPAADLCRRTLRVFSGWTRFDLALKGPLDDAAAPPAGSGAPRRVACATEYRPISGHRAESPGVERLRAPGAVALTLAPIGDGLWGPDRLAIATRFGTFEAVRR